MLLPKELLHGILIKRYKRFLADIELADATILTVHCPNSGSMKGCSAPGSPVIISQSTNKNRKYPWTLELVQVNGSWVGVNTSLTNKLVYEALRNGTIDDFGMLDEIRPEVKVSQKSRLDFLLTAPGQRTYLEVKNCSLAEDGNAMFPDAVTARGTKHLEELMTLMEGGDNAAVLFCIQRTDATRFSPAGKIDPLYAHTLKKAAHAGVSVLAYMTDIHLPEITIARKLPVYL